MNTRPAHRTPTDPLLRQWLEASTFEIVPIHDMDAALASVPVNMRLHVTCSPAQEPAHLLDVARAIARRRPDVTLVPHIAARRIHDRQELISAVHTLAEAGIKDVFVISGDRTDHAAGYIDGLGAIRDLRDIAPDFGGIGIPGYPGGHPFISDAALGRALQEKACYATFICTQMCFRAQDIASWLRNVRAAGVDLPVYIGIPGVMDRARLLHIAARIGVSQSTRFLRLNRQLAGKLLSASTYRPDAILAGLARVPDIRQLGIAGFNLFTFNEVQATEAWRQELLARP